MINFFWNGGFGRLHSRGDYSELAGGVGASSVCFGFLIFAISWAYCFLGFVQVHHSGRLIRGS
jgi:hypothetical protein